MGGDTEMSPLAWGRGSKLQRWQRRGRNPARPKRPERVYMNILQNVTRIILRSVSHLEMDDTVPGCEHELGGPRHALPALAL